MNLPENVSQVGIFLAMLVPGLSFATARVFFVGWRSPDYGPGSRVLDALYASAVFLVVYGAVGVWLAGGTLSGLERKLLDAWKDWPTWIVALLATLLLVVLPAATGWLVSARYRAFTVIEDGAVKTIRRQVNRSRPEPRAWDYGAFAAVTPRFVRIRTESGEYFGGWYGGDSYVSTYPHPRDIFIEAQWRMNTDGSFDEPIQDSLGVWVPITDGCVVEWLQEREENA